MSEERSNLVDGSEWADHEDCIVGNERGLRALANACEEALKNGEYYGDDLGDYVGVKRMSDEWFKATVKAPQTKFENAILGVGFLTIFALTIVGIYNVAKWIFS